MNEKDSRRNRQLAIVLRIASVLIALMGLGMLICTLPGVGLTAENVSVFYRAAIWALAVPCYGALLLFRKMVDNIAADRSFCLENAQYLRQIAVLALTDTVLTLLCGTVAILCRDLPVLLIAGIFCVAILGFGMTAASLALSYLVKKAQKIEEENDFTI